MGGAASNFLEPKCKRHHRRRDTDRGATKSFKFFMRHLRKLLKHKKPHMTKPEVNLLGKVLWGKLAPGERRVFAVELAKKTRKKLDVKRKSTASSRLSTLFDTRVRRSRRRKRPVVVNETIQRTDQQAGPSGRNPHPAPRPPTPRPGQESSPPATDPSGPLELPRAFERRGSRIYTVLSTAVSRHYAERSGSRPRAQPQEQGSPRPRVKRRLPRPRTMLATAVSRHYAEGEMEVDNDSSDYEGGFLYSGASTTSMSSTFVSSERGGK